MLQDGKENVDLLINLFAKQHITGWLFLWYYNKWIDGNVFHLVTAKVLIYSVKVL